MGEVGALLVSMLVFYFIFALLAQFIIGKIIILIGSVALGVLVYKLCSDIEERKTSYLIGSIILTGLLAFIYYTSTLGDSACDSYYIGTVTDSKYEPIQNGHTITKENYSKICHFPGLKNACRQYEECRKIAPIFQPLALFLFGLLCSSIGAVIGLLQPPNQKSG